MSTSVDTWSCSAIATQLPTILDEPKSAPPSLYFHVEQCLTCQAELARTRRMLRMLRGLRADDLPLPRGMLSDLFVAVEKAGHRRAIRSILSGRRIAYLSGLGLGLVATGAIVIVARTHRPRALRASKRHVRRPIA